MTDSVPGSTWTRERFNEELRQTVGSTSQVIDLYRRYLNQIWEERDRLSALASAAAAARDTAIADQKNTSEALRKVKERLRDAKAGLPSPPTYRLPDWLGGHPVQSIDPDGDMVIATFANPEAPHGTSLTVQLFPSQLVEVRPPSIDDPAPWPLEIDDDLSDACLYLHDDNEGPEYSDQLAELRVRVREEHLADSRGGHRTAHIRLSAADLLRLAQAAYQRWQRATAVEGGAV